jgi:hypothetical protein
MRRARRAASRLREPDRRCLMCRAEYASEHLVANGLVRELGTHVAP